MNNCFVPVLLFAYARPDHLARTLTALKENGVRQIFAFADGAKTPDKEEAVLATRKLLRAVDWCDISIVEREKNLGLGVSIITGVTELFKKFDTLIVIEDDIVMRAGAYQFLCSALKFYEQDARIFSISLWSHPQLVPKINEPVFFCPRFNCWGWGAYRRSWIGMETPAVNLIEQCRKKNINAHKYGSLKSFIAEEHNRNTWATRFALIHYLNNGINVWPTELKAFNIGCDGTGTNSSKIETINITGSLSLSTGTCFPAYKGINASSAQFTKFYEGSVCNRKIITPLKVLVNAVKKMFLMRNNEI